MFGKTLAAALIAFTLTACATTDSGQTGSIQDRHQHLRDAKQGSAASSDSVVGQPAKKPLHDHREMK